MDRYGLARHAMVIMITGTPGDRSDSHAGELKTLAESHMADHAVSHKRESLEEAISIYGQLLQLRPVGHQRRAEAVADLADALFHFCAEHGTDIGKGAVTWARVLPRPALASAGQIRPA
jgi:hypothetical protein